jgi:hypothetical protein
MKLMASSPAVRRASMARRSMRSPREKLSAHGPQILTDEDRDFGIVETTVNAVQNATSVIIEPPMR